MLGQAGVGTALFALSLCFPAVLAGFLLGTGVQLTMLTGRRPRRRSSVDGFVGALHLWALVGGFLVVVVIVLAALLVAAVPVPTRGGCLGATSGTDDGYVPKRCGRRLCRRAAPSGRRDRRFRRYRRADTLENRSRDGDAEPQYLPTRESAADVLRGSRVRDADPVSKENFHVSERTLVLIKPDGVKRGLIGDVIARVERKGLKVVAMDLRTLDVDTAKAHYAEHSERPFFGELVEFITSARWWRWCSRAPAPSRRSARWPASPTR